MFEDGASSTWLFEGDEDNMPSTTRVRLFGTSMKLCRHDPSGRGVGSTRHQDPESYNVAGRYPAGRSQREGDEQGVTVAVAGTARRAE